MSNKTNHRVPVSDRNQHHEELHPESHRPGHSGQLTRSKWKDISRRSERRALNNASGNAPHVTKRKGRPVTVDATKLDVEGV